MSDPASGVVRYSSGIKINRRARDLPLGTPRERGVPLRSPFRTPRSLVDATTTTRRRRDDGRSP
jgi:hypothetical protein